MNLDERVERRSVLKLDEIRSLFRQGSVSAAVPVAHRAYEFTLKTDDENLIGTALSNLGIALVLAGRGAQIVPSLSGWLEGTADDYVAFCAARTLAIHFRLSGQEPDLPSYRIFSQKAYASAERSGVAMAQVDASYELGLAFTADNRYDEATELFGDSIRRLEADPHSRGTPHLTGLGYCLTRGERIGDGIRALSLAIHTAQADGAPSHEISARLYLASSMLDVHRPRDAELHLNLALQLGHNLPPGMGRTLEILHLLGDALKMQRRSREAFKVFQRLQSAHYPTEEGLAEILMEVDARRRINVL